MPKQKDKRSRRTPTRQSFIGIVIVIAAVCVLIVVLLYQCVGLRKKIRSFAASNAQLETEIQEQEERAKEIQNLPEYIQSDEYIEKIAREKFGLVYKDEIIFKAQE